MGQGYNPVYQVQGSNLGIKWEANVGGPGKSVQYIDGPVCWRDWSENQMGEVGTRSALKGIGRFKPISEYVLPLELKRGWGFGHKWPLGWGHDKLRLLFLIQENKSIEGYYFLPASAFIPCLDILVVITLVSQFMFRKSDQILRYQAWPNTKWERRERRRVQTGLEQPYGAQVDSWLLEDQWCA